MKSLTKEAQQELAQMMSEGKAWDKLSDIMAYETGFKIAFDVELTEKRNGEDLYFKVKSKANLVSLAGIFSKALTDLRMENFGGSFSNAEGHHQYWFPLHFSYTHIGGGMNGCDFVNLSYDIEDGVWKKD